MSKERKIKKGDVLVITRSHYEDIAPMAVIAMEDDSDGYPRFKPNINGRSLLSVDDDTWYFEDEYEVETQAARKVKKGDELLITRINDEYITPTVVVVEKDAYEGIPIFRPEINGCSSLSVEHDDWVFLNEADEDKTDYDDEAPSASYTELASDGMTITDLTEGTLTAASLSFKELERKTIDNVNSPSHYTTGQWEVIDILEDLAKRYPDPVDAYLVSTAAKYLFRSPFKGAQEQDIRKAIWYLTRLADNMSERNEK